MPPRFASVASILLALTIVIVSTVIAPRQTLAAETAVAAFDTLLRAGPEADAPALAPVPTGASVELTGPPEGEAYPVSYDGLAGWLEAQALTITKSDPGAGPAAGETRVDPATVDAAPAGESIPTVTTPVPPAPTSPAEIQEPAETALVEPTATIVPEPAPATEEPATVAPAADGAAPTATGAELILTAIAGAGDDPVAIATAIDTAIEPASAPPTEAAPSPTATNVSAATATPATTQAPAATAATETESTIETSPEAAESGTPESAPTAAAATEPDPATTPAAELEAAPTSEPEGAAAGDDEQAEEAADDDDLATEPALPTTWGPATAADDLSLFAAPDTSAAVLFYVPEGSTLTQTGTTRGRFVSADFMGILGWVHRDFLAEPSQPAAEAPPLGTAVPVRTARPGSGVAFARVDLPLRAGPSANETAVGAIPAGERLILTGVMENGFQRVEYRGQIGWVADEYLSTPADPEPALAPPAPSGVGGGGGRSPRADRAPEPDSQQEIVRIIERAADRYNQPPGDMLRVARCESNLDPNAVNPSGSYGLFQFIRSTWQTTPYADQDIFDPVANANAAAWMWSVGRRNEWVCQ